MAINYGRRYTDFPKKKLVTGLYYYIALTVLLFALGTATYWQLEEDSTVFEVTELSVTVTPEDRSFFVPVSFCSSKGLSDFTVVRYYHDLDNDIYYPVPDGRYKTSVNNCFKTRLQGYTGRLSPGNYEYHIYVNYDLNPLRNIHQLVANVRVTVE